MAHPHYLKLFKGKGTYRLCWKKDGQTDHYDKTFNTAEELEEAVERAQKQGYWFTSIARL